MGNDPTVAVIIAALGALALVMAPIGAGLVTRGGRAVAAPAPDMSPDLDRLRDDLARERSIRDELRDELTDERARHAQAKADRDLARLERDELRVLLDAMIKKGGGA